MITEKALELITRAECINQDSEYLEICSLLYEFKVFVEGLEFDEVELNPMEKIIQDLNGNIGGNSATD